MTPVGVKNTRAGGSGNELEALGALHACFSDTRERRSDQSKTRIDEPAIAAAASAGPPSRSSAPNAASGTASALYPNAHARFAAIVRRVALASERLLERPRPIGHAGFPSRVAIERDDIAVVQQARAIHRRQPGVVRGDADLGPLLRLAGRGLQSGQFREVRL